MGHAFFGLLCVQSLTFWEWGRRNLPKKFRKFLRESKHGGSVHADTRGTLGFCLRELLWCVMSARLWTTVARTVEEVTHGYPRGEDIKPIVTHDGKTLIEVLEQRLAARDSINQCNEERERIKQQNKRLLVAAAAENRRWQQQYRKPTLSVPTLLELAEVALGEAYVKVCEDLRPEADYCGLAWTPSAIDHNNEPCRITLKRPAVESWTDGDATRKKDSSGK